MTQPTGIAPQHPRPYFPAKNVYTDFLMNQARNDLGHALHTLAIQYHLSDGDMARLLVDELADWMKTQG